MVPTEHIYSNQVENSCKWWQDLLGDVVGGVEAQAGVLQYLYRTPNQLYERHSWHTVHNNIWHTLTNTWLQTSIIRHHTPKTEKNLFGQQPLWDILMHLDSAWIQNKEQHFQQR